MTLRIHGAPRPGLVILLLVVAAGAAWHLAQSGVAKAGRMASVPPLSRGVLDPMTRAKTFEFALGEAQSVELSVYDATGRLVHHVPASMFPAGEFAIPWDGTDDFSGRESPPGLYTARYDFATWTARRLLVLGGIP